MKRSYSKSASEGGESRKSNENSLNSHTSNETDVASSSEFRSPEQMRRQGTLRLTDIIPYKRPKYSYLQDSTPLTRDAASVENVDESDSFEFQNDSLSSNRSREYASFAPDEVLEFRTGDSQGVCSPLPDLIIEKEKIKTSDEPEEFYEALEMKMAKLYRKHILKLDDDASSQDSIDILYERTRLQKEGGKDEESKGLPEPVERTVSEGFATTSDANKEADSTEVIDKTGSSDVQTPELMRNRRSSRLTDVFGLSKRKYSGLHDFTPQTTQVDSFEENDALEYSSRRVSPIIGEEDIAISPNEGQEHILISPNEGQKDISVSPILGQQYIPVFPDDGEGYIPFSPNEVQDVRVSSNEGEKDVSVSQNEGYKHILLFSPEAQENFTDSSNQSKEQVPFSSIEGQEDEDQDDTTVSPSNGQKHTSFSPNRGRKDVTIPLNKDQEDESILPDENQEYAPFSSNKGREDVTITPHEGQEDVTIFPDAMMFNETDEASSSDSEPIRRQRTSRLTDIIPYKRPKYSYLQYTRELRAARIESVDVESVDVSDPYEFRDDSPSSNGSRKYAPFALDDVLEPRTLESISSLTRNDVNSQGVCSPLPDLIIEKEKIKSSDEPEEFYERLEKKMAKLYRKYILDDDASSQDSIFIQYENMCLSNGSRGDGKSNDKSVPEQVERTVSEGFAKTSDANKEVDSMETGSSDVQTPGLMREAQD